MGQLFIYHIHVTKILIDSGRAFLMGMHLPGNASLLIRYSSKALWTDVKH